MFTALGDTVRFSAQVRDQRGRVITGASVRWASSDASVASITASGLARAISGGSTTITAVAGAASDSAGVEVRQEIARVVVSPAMIELDVGDTIRLLTQAQDANGNPVDASGFVWMSDNEYVATVDSAGMVRARVRGSATITAGLGTFSGNADLTVVLPHIPPNPKVDEGTSHSLQFGGLYVSHERLREGRFQDYYYPAAIAYLDFNGDGRIDIFHSPLDGSRNAVPAQVYINNGMGWFDFDDTFLGQSPPGGVNPRKALPGDFNGDGRPDVLVVDHGYDHPPFPGASPYAVLSSDSGYVQAEGLDDIIGFHHGGASADIDADGDLDVVVTDNFTRPFFLVNDGAGAFTWDTTRIQGIEYDLIFTAELVDVDRDGYADLLAAGHEYEGFPAQILWGDDTGVFSTAKGSILPPVPGHGIVVDIDVADTDGDGDRDIVLNRTGDETGPGWYEGYHVQLLEHTATRVFADMTSQRLGGHQDADADWITWLRIHDIDEDGDPDVFADEASRRLVWRNDGSGTFRPGPLAVVPPNHTADAGTSHSLQNPPFMVDHSAVRDGRTGWAQAWAYGDFDGDDDVDIFYAPMDNDGGSLPAEFHLNDGQGGFSLDAGLFSGTLPSMEGASKALPGDYNADGRLDVLVIGTGDNSDVSPYVVLSSADRYVPGPPLDAFAGVNYGGASADIDADGDLDVFLSGPRSFMLNDGSGAFRAGSRVEGLDQFVIAAELVDVDSNGYVDLLVGGHEFEGDPVQIIWGDSTGVYSVAGRTILPAVGGHGVILDMDVADTDGDGDKDVVVTRTGDESGPGFHRGYYLQLLENAGGGQFRDVTSAWMPENRDDRARSFSWIRVYDSDGDSDVDIVVDDYTSTGLLWRNDGAGRFQRVTAEPEVAASPTPPHLVGALSWLTS